MQICPQCQTSLPDDALACTNCGAELPRLSEQAAELKKLQANPRVTAVQIQVAFDACPACIDAKGVYEKDQLPSLPVEACSHQHGCRCHYAPILSEIFP